MKKNFIDMKHIKSFRIFESDSNMGFDEMKSFFTKNKKEIYSYYNFLFSNCGNATLKDDFQKRWEQLQGYISRNFNYAFSEFGNWLKGEYKNTGRTRPLKLGLKDNLEKWKERNPQLVDVVANFEDAIGFQLL